jgi:DNA recombination-dependent growth factor C
MTLIAGPFSGRIWRTVDSLPPHFDELVERNLPRHAFKPVNAERGELRSIGWVNIRQLLDTRLTLPKAMFDGALALGLRIDRITINMRLFKATLMQEAAKIAKEKKREKLSREERAAIEDQVKQKLIRDQIPSTSIYEMIWHLESGIVLFTGAGDKLCAEFSDLFTETFNVSIEPQFPFYRAERFAKRQHLERELMEAYPTPFSPTVPAQVHEIDASSLGEA